MSIVSHELQVIVTVTVLDSESAENFELSATGTPGNVVLISESEKSYIIIVPISSSLLPLLQDTPPIRHNDTKIAAIAKISNFFFFLSMIFLRKCGRWKSVFQTPVVMKRHSADFVK